MKGAIAGIAASVVLGVGDSKLSLGGMVWSAPTVIGISVAGASLASELSHDYIYAKIKPNASLAEFEQKALSPCSLQPPQSLLLTLALAPSLICALPSSSEPSAQGPR